MTTSSKRLTAVFRQWVEQPETYAFLANFTRIKSQRAENAPLFEGERPEDLVQEFLLFLFDRFLVPEKLSPDLMHLIGTAQFRRILELAWGKFIWQFREQARSKKRNPRGYMYRRLREMLPRSPDRFAVIRLHGKYPYYSPVNSAADPNIDPLEDAAIDHARLPAPPPPKHPVDKHVFSKKWLLDTADFYWHQVMRDTSQPRALSVRSLCRYIAEHHPWLNAPQQQEDIDTESLADLSGEKGTMEEHLLRLDGLQSVAPLAAQLVATWSIPQRQVFIWRISTPQVTYETIAERLGLADHHKARALFRQTEKSLLQFTANWPGLPLAELPEEVAVSFIEEIKRLCKNSLPCP